MPIDAPTLQATARISSSIELKPLEVNDATFVPRRVAVAITMSLKEIFAIVESFFLDYNANVALRMYHGVARYSN